MNIKTRPATPNEAGCARGAEATSGLKIVSSACSQALEDTRRTMNPPKLPSAPCEPGCIDGDWMLSWCTLWLRYWAIRSAAGTGEPCKCSTQSI